jgi:hypothetical protein
MREQKTDASCREEIISTNDLASQTVHCTATAWQRLIELTSGMALQRRWWRHVLEEYNSTF